MSDLIKKIKIKKQDDTYTDYIPIGAEAKNVDCSDGESVEYKLNKKPYYYKSVADMKADTKLKVGDMAITLGYYSVNDGGNGEYRIVSGTYTDDGGSYHQLNNNLYAELIIKNGTINIKQFGAKSDGITDNTSIFNTVTQKFISIFIPKGKYKINTTINLQNNTKIYGESVISCWSGGSAIMSEIISPENNYSFHGNWGYVNEFYNLCFNGYGIDQPCGTRINNCEFKGEIGLNNVRVSSILQCSFHNCATAGIKKMTDSKITNCFFYGNEIGIDMTDSNDNMITNNKIEWNGIGINIKRAVFNLIDSNIFDRSTTYGIVGANTTQIEITNNQFERNLTNHINISGAQLNISNNSFFAKNSEDDGTGTSLPLNAIYTPSISDSKIQNNLTSWWNCY